MPAEKYDAAIRLKIICPGNFQENYQSDKAGKNQPCQHGKHQSFRLTAALP
jgi:hypothetical protein